MCAFVIIIIIMHSNILQLYIAALHRNELSTDLLAWIFINNNTLNLVDFFTNYL
jgi:hypothetical protein